MCVCVCVCVLSHFSLDQLFVTLWTAAHQPPLIHGILQAKILQWVAIPFSMGSSQPRNGTPVSCVFCITSRFFITEPLSKPMIMSGSCI